MRRKFESKEIQRAKLAKLVNLGRVSCKGKFTRGVKTRGDDFRMLLDVTIFLKGERIYLDHLWIKNKREYNKYEGRILDFRAEVKFWNYEKTKAGLTKVYVKKYIRKSEGCK